MQFNFEPGIALVGSIIFLVFVAIAFFFAISNSKQQNLDEVSLHQNDIERAEEKLKNATRRERKNAQAELKRVTEEIPEMVSPKKNIFGASAFAVVLYLFISVITLTSSTSPIQVDTADQDRVFETQYGAVNDHTYTDLNLASFTGTSVEGSTTFGFGRVNSYPTKYVTVSYRYEEVRHFVTVDVNDIEVTLQDGVEPMLEFGIPKFNWIWWARVQRVYKGCSLEINWIWPSCEREFISERLVIDQDAPSLSELIVDGDVSVSIIMTPQQYAELSAGI